MSELESFVKQPFPSPNAIALARKSLEYDKQGSSIWNAATKILRNHESGDALSSGVDLPRFCMLLRAFAFFLLDAAHNTSTRRTKDSDQRIRMFKIALKASRFSLDNNDLDLAFKLLESCSKYISAWDEATPIIRVTSDDCNDEASIISSLTSEYYLFRMAHASKSGRLDLILRMQATAVFQSLQQICATRSVAPKDCKILSKVLCRGLRGHTNCSTAEMRHVCL